MKTKICTKCGEEKAATTEFFHKLKRGKYGLAAGCKSCVKIYVQQNKEKISKRKKQYREANKEKLAEYRKQYYQANKERKLEYRKQYYEANEEKIAEYQKQYYEANKEKISEQSKKYYKDNKEEILKTRKQFREANKEYIKQYREANKEKLTEYRKQYGQKNKHLSRQSNAKRRAQKLKQTPDYANLDLIKLIYKNCPDGYEVDHINPISSGGLHHESNLCYLPEGINQSKGAKTIEEFGEDVFSQHVIYWQDYLTPF